MDFTLKDIADRIGGRVVGDGDRRMTGVATLDTAGPGDLTFVVDAKRLPGFMESEAGAAIVPRDSAPEGFDVIEHDNPYAGIAAALAHLHPERRPEPGISPRAEVHADATVHPTASVAAFAVVEAGAEVGEGAVIGAASFIGADCRVGAGTLVHPQVVIYAGTVLGKDCTIHSGSVIGADGFGYVRHGGRHVKIPQVGNVVLGDEVDVGANSCIDRGMLDSTRIGKGSKLDNLVQVGHNCQVGERAILCGMVGVGGSAKIGDDATLAARAGLGGHVTVGTGGILAQGSDCMRDVAAGHAVAGSPAMPLRTWKRAQALYPKLPELRSQMRQLQRRLDALEAGADANAE